MDHLQTQLATISDQLVVSIPVAQASRLFGSLNNRTTGPPPLFVHAHSGGGHPAQSFPAFLLK